MKIVGYGVIALAVVVGIAAALAASWFLLVGGILDLADGRVVSSGIPRIDDWNSEYSDDWGRTRVGLLKVFVLEPIALVLIALVTRALIGAGRALVRRAAPAPSQPVPADVPVAAAVAPAPDLVAVGAPLPASSPPTWGADDDAGTREPEPIPDTEQWPEPVAEAEPPAEPAPEPEPVFEPVPFLEEEPVFEPDPVVVASAAAVAPSDLPSLGATIPLETMRAEHETIEVTLLEVVDPVGAASPNRPDRYVAVRLAVEKSGSGQFEDMPTAGAFLVGADGERYRTGAQKVEPALREIRLSAGERCDGYLSFKLPAGIAPASFRFTPNLGLASETGEWQLAG